jgi:hypothetical protein
MRRLIVVITILAIPSAAFTYKGTPKNQVALFFKDIAAGKSTEAIDNLYSSNPAFSQKQQQLTLLKQQLATVTTLYGTFIGSEKIHYEELSPSLIRIVQVAKHEIHPILWEFYFYKPRNNWMISQGKFVDQFQVVGTNK